jgi:hypothetical protein
MFPLTYLKYRDISGFRRDTLEAFALLGRYVAWVGAALPMFRDSLSVPSAGEGSETTYLLLGAFAKLRTQTISLRRVCPSVLPSA